MVCLEEVASRSVVLESCVFLFTPAKFRDDLVVSLLFEAFGSTA